MNFPRFWADDFDMDLPRVLPDMDDLLGNAANIPLWTHGHTSYGRLNHPSVWGTEAYFGLSPDSTGKPDSYRTSNELVECTWREVVRDAWPHMYVVMVDRRPVWEAYKLTRPFMDLMYDLRGQRRLPEGRADEIRAYVRNDVAAATERLRLLVDLRAAGGPR